MNSSKDWGIFGNLNFTHIVVACNTFHLLEQEVTEMVGMPILSLIDTVRDEIVRQNIKKVALLATPTTINSRLFHDKLQSTTDIVCLDSIVQKKTEDLIRLTIANRASTITNNLKEQIETFKVLVILGCTELSVVADLLDLDGVIDPLNLVVEKIFND